GSKRMAVGPIVDAVIEGKDWLLSLIRNRDSSMASKRHGEKAVQTLIAANGQHLGFPAVVIPQAKSEEIAYRRLDAGGCFSVPIHAQNDAFEMIGLIVRNGEPDMRYLPRTVDIKHRERGPRRNPAGVCIRSPWICA